MEELIRLLGILVALLVYLLPLLSRVRRGRAQDIPEEPPVDRARKREPTSDGNDPFAEPSRARAPVQERQPESYDEEWSAPWAVEEDAGEEWWGEAESTPERPPTSTGEGYDSDAQLTYTDPRMAAADDRMSALEGRAQNDSRGAAIEERMRATRQRAEYDPRVSAVEERARAIRQRAEYDPRGAAIQERARAISLRAEQGEQRADALQQRLARVGTSQQRAASLDKRSALIQERLDLIEQRAGAAERLMLKRADQSPTTPSGKTVAAPQPLVDSSQRIVDAWVLRTLLTPRRNIKIGRPTRQRNA